MNRINRLRNHIIYITLWILAVAPPAAFAQLPSSEFEGPAFEFEEVRDGIFLARGTGAVSVGANAGIVINEEDVMVVDSQISPAAAAALLTELQAITTKPVRYVVNTHFHFDHAHGNQIYPSDVHIIGHEFTHMMLATGGSVGRTYQGFLESMADQPGFTAGQVDLAPTPPNSTFSERLTLFRGDREIQLLFFGRGHTGGDVVVYLPAERVLFTGDLILPGLPYMGDGFVEDWVQTLEGVKALDFEVILPGHGRPVTDPSRIDHLQAYLRDLWKRVNEAHSKGLTAQEASEQIDMTDHTAHYAQIEGPGVSLATIERIYELLRKDD